MDNENSTQTMTEEDLIVKRIINASVELARKA